VCDFCFKGPAAPESGRGPGRIPAGFRPPNSKRSAWPWGIN